MNNDVRKPSICLAPLISRYGPCFGIDKTEEDCEISVLDQNVHRHTYNPRDDLVQLPTRSLLAG